MPEYTKGICSECGSPIYTSERDKHTEFHAKFDELVDWAQSVSALFRPTEKPQHEWEPGDPIE